MPDLDALLNEAASRLPVATPPFSRVVARRRRRAAAARAGVAAAVLLSGTAAASGLLAHARQDRVLQTADAPLPRCSPAPAGVLLGAREPGPYGTGLAAAVLARLDGWRLSAPNPQTGDFAGCAAGEGGRKQMREAHYPLADYDPEVGAHIKLETAAGPSGLTIQLDTGRYVPRPSKRDALVIARGFLSQQAEEWQRMIDTDPSREPGEPTAAVALEPVAEGPATEQGHWWIFRGLQNKFGFAWTPDGSLTVARLDPDPNTALSQEQLRDALLAAADYQSNR